MRETTLVLLLATAGCGALPFPVRGPNAIQPDGAYPHEFEYVMLEQAVAKACATADELKQIASARSKDPATNGHPALFERAKFDAIALVKGADGLAAVTAKVEIVDGKQCVSVRGHAYRITQMRAVGAKVRAEHIGRSLAAEDK